MRYAHMNTVGAGVGLGFAAGLVVGGGQIAPLDATVVALAAAFGGVANAIVAFCAGEP